MNKLLKFAGVSALALITAAPSAFGAVAGAQGFGRYDAHCQVRTLKTIRFLVPSARGYRLSPKVFYYNVAEHETIKDEERWLDGGENTITADNLIQKLVETLGIKQSETSSINFVETNGGDGTITVGNISTALLPYAALYVGTLEKAFEYVYPRGGNFEAFSFDRDGYPQSTDSNADFTIFPFQSITVGSTCLARPAQSTDLQKLNILMNGKTYNSKTYDESIHYHLKTRSTSLYPDVDFMYNKATSLPNIKGIIDEATLAQSDEIYYVIQYAADCLNADGQATNMATCSLEFRGNGADYFVEYTNACLSGADAEAGSFTSPVESSYCPVFISPEVPAAGKSGGGSTPPKYENANPPAGA